MNKIYEIQGLASARLIFNYQGTQVTAHFQGGNRHLGRNARLVTDNIIVQQAIEHDSRFGTSIKRIG